MRKVARMRRVMAIAMMAAMCLPYLSAEEKRPAAGISTPFGDVLIENLGIGRTYNLRELAGKPYTVTNKGADTMELQIDVVKPTLSMISEKRRKLGFVPIADPGWIKLSQNRILVPTGETAFTDMLITIPNDPSLYSKKFQVSINAYNDGKGFLNLGVWSHFLITITPSPEAQAQAELNRKRGLMPTMDYRLTVDRLYIPGAPRGRKYDVRKEFKSTVKIANSGEKPIDLKVSIVPLKDTPLSLQGGFEEPGDIRWLRVGAERIRVKPDIFFDPELTLQLPDDPKISKKNLMFIMKVEPAKKEDIGLTYYASIYVTVE